jgi:hypothetical protein
MIVVRALIESGIPTRFEELCKLVSSRLWTISGIAVHKDVHETLDQSDAFVEVEPGTWDFASNYSAEQVQDMRLRRLERSDGRKSSRS